MKKIIGITILVFILVFLIVTTCLMCGDWKTGLICWGIGFAVAMVICFAIFLIEDDT